MTNIEKAREIITTLARAGVQDFVLCGGSRNAPLVAALAAANSERRTANVYTFVDERSAAFFALGRSKRDERPVAVVTTSGTAVAELLPAAIEAFYSGVPLILVTADRPARFRTTGAPQAINQVGIFGEYATTAIDDWSRHAPLHINVEFDEPLIDE